MEKTIKMSLETAREIYKNYEGSIRTFVLENFTKEELEGKKGFTWEDSYNGGYYIDIHTDTMYNTGFIGSLLEYKGAFKTQKQALSALAFAQLSHIVAKYNEGKTFSNIDFKIEQISSGQIQVNSHMTVNRENKLCFCDKQDAETSLKVNKDLWKQYWMI